jgi:hypothetical protein
MPLNIVCFARNVIFKLASEFWQYIPALRQLPLFSVDVGGLALCDSPSFRFAVSFVLSLRDVGNTFLL